MCEETSQWAFGKVWISLWTSASVMSSKCTGLLAPNKVTGTLSGQCKTKTQTVPASGS